MKEDQSVKTERIKHSGNVNKSHSSTTNTALEKIEEKTPEKVLARDKKLLTNVPKRRGRPPRSKIIMHRKLGN